MRFSSTVLFAAVASLACAQNPFTFTTTPVVTAGTPFNITWAPSTGTVDTITLLLRQGDPQHLATVLTIAASIKNVGSYLWTPPTSLVQGTGYAFEIIDDGNNVIVNYSNQFSITSSNTVSSAVPASTTSGSSSLTPSTSAASVSQTTVKGTTTTATSAGTQSSQTGSSASAGTTSSGTSTGSATSSTVPATVTHNAAAGLKVGGAVAVVLGAVAAVL